MIKIDGKLYRIFCNFCKRKNLAKCKRKGCNKKETKKGFSILSNFKVFCHP